MTDKWLSHVWLPLSAHPTIETIPSDPEWLTAPFDLAITWAELDGARYYAIYWWFNVFNACEALDELQAAYPDAVIKGCHLEKGQRWSPIGLAPDPPDTHRCN